MSQQTLNTLSLKVSLIPEEGIDREWVIDADRFSSETHPIPVTGLVKAGGRLYRTGADVYFNGHVSARLKLECSRCLAVFNFVANSDVSAVFLPDHEGEQKKTGGTDDTEARLYDGYELDMFAPLRDHVALAVPMRPLCDEECKGLCPDCGTNLNKETCSCCGSAIDPRLAVLKKLLTNRENPDAGTEEKDIA